MNPMEESLLRVVRCTSCQHDILLPGSMPGRTNPYLESSGMDFAWINVACLECKQASRYNIDQTHYQVYVPPLQGQHPDGTVAFAVLLRCDDQSCRLPVLIESAAKAGTTIAALRGLAARWVLAADVTCHSGNPPKLPPVVDDVFAT